MRLWDTRTRARVATFRVHEDFVADMHHAAARNTLLTASGDGTLAVLDLRASQVVARSDNQEDELLSGASRVGLAPLRSQSCWTDDDDQGFATHPKGALGATICLNF